MRLLIQTRKRTLDVGGAARVAGRNRNGSRRASAASSSRSSGS